MKVQKWREASKNKWMFLILFLELIKNQYYM